jgi:hypothetical protein
MGEVSAFKLGDRPQSARPCRSGSRNCWRPEQAGPEEIRPGLESARLGCS